MSIFSPNCLGYKKLPLLKSTSIINYLIEEIEHFLQLLKSSIAQRNSSVPPISSSSSSSCPNNQANNLAQKPVFILTALSILERPALGLPKGQMLRSGPLSYVLSNIILVFLTWHQRFQNDALSHVEQSSLLPPLYLL